MMDIITKIAYVALALILVVVVVFGVINAEGPVDCTVISCEETDPYVNQAAKTMATMNFMQGKYTSSMMYGSMAQPQARYIVVVEYEGVQYEIETAHKYEVGEVVQLPNPAKN